MPLVQHRLKHNRAGAVVFVHAHPLALNHHRAQHREAPFGSLAMQPLELLFEGFQTVALALFAIRIVGIFFGHSRVST